MAADSLSYVGINRAYSDFAGTHACEELINLRPASEGVVPVKDFSTFLSNVGYDRIFVHHATDGDHYIVIWKSSLGVTAQVLGGADGKTPLTPILFNIGADSAAKQQRVIDNLSFAAAGNVIVFSVCDTEDGILENLAFTRKAPDGGTMTYIATEANVPTGLDYTIVSEKVTVDGNVRVLIDSSPAEVCEAQESALNAVQEDNPDLCVGPVIIAIAYKAQDGKTFWTGKWRVHDPVADVGTSYPPYVDANTPDWSGVVSDPNRDWAAYFDKYGHAYETFGGASGSTSLFFKVTGTKVKLQFTGAGNWNKETSIIQSVEVYSSRPVPYLDTSAANDAYFVLGSVWCLPQKKYSDMELADQPLYHQASIPMESLASLSYGETLDVALSFGGNVQVTEETLDTDAGELKRYGKVVAYNARFHFYDSVAKMAIGTPSFNWPSGTTHSASIFVRYADEDQSDLVYVGSDSDYTGKAYFVIAPSINIKEVITYATYGGNYYVKQYRMKASSTYNYSICEEGPYAESDGSGTLSKYENRIGSDSKVTNIERAAINVSEQYNPFVFMVEHSYLAPGNVIDVQPQMAGITDASYGRDPLNVFTERGLYALTQGSANVLYGAFLPVSQLVVNRSAGAVPTEQGVFFLADGALWLASGRRATLISDALSLGPHKYIRSCPGYKRISGDQDGEILTPEYDVDPYVSKVSFEEFVRSGGRLSFNRFRMELFVSNKDYDYSYVLSLKYRQWFKISKCLWQDDLGSDLVTAPGATEGNIDVLDLRNEEDGSVLVHLQSRPFSMGYRYIHMHRIVAMVRARLESQDHKMAVGLYGSDDLQRWKLLAYAVRSAKEEYDDQEEELAYTPLYFSQIRTTPAARSWRYFTVCIGGVVPTDTDLGPVLVDYEPVIRRIG